MTKFGSGLTRRFPVGMLILCLMLFMMTPVAQAAYEVDQSSFKPDVQTNSQTQWKDKNLNVEFNAVTMTGSDIFVRILYIWSSATTSPSDDDFRSKGTEAIKSGTTYVASRLAGDLAAMDYGDTLFLHLRTEYLDSNNLYTPTLSTGDIPYGPFLIDNTAPTGKIWLVDGTGATITSTSSTDLMVKAAASQDPQKVYIYETSVRPSKSQNYNNGNLLDPYPLMDTDTVVKPGKIIYAWFEDAVGNISNPATVAFTLLPAVSISPYTATIDPSVGMQAFQVGDGATAYTWNIINQVQDPSGTNVATFEDGSTEIASSKVVNVKGNNKGTFKVTATAADSTVLTSGTITVVQTLMRGDVNKDGEITAQDAVDCFWLAFQTTWTSTELSTADFNQDNEVTSQDAVDIFWKSLQ